jgi:hypothetical protein
VIAICGPGRRRLVVLELLLAGEQVTAVYESPDIPDPAAVILVDPAALDPAAVKDAPPCAPATSTPTTRPTGTHRRTR